LSLASLLKINLGNMQTKKLKEKIENEIEKVEAQQETDSLLDTFLSYEGKDEVITSKEALEELREEMRKPPIKMMSGLPTLDKILDGFRVGDLVVLSAPTKMGKTTFAQSLTHNFAQKDIPSLWFSYELRQQDFLAKFGEPIPYFTLPKNLTNTSLGWIEKRIVESIAKYGTKVVFIDHLHYLIGLESISQRAGISLLIGGLMRELKKICIKWNLCLFLIAHTTKLKYDQPPELSDIRDSSFISQEADTVLLMWRLKEKKSNIFTNEARLIVGANRRNGQSGGVNLIFKDNRFYEKDNS